MSAENVELVRGLFAATDGMSSDEFLAALPGLIPEVCDPEIEFVETPERIDARTYRGFDGVLQAWKNWFEQFENYEFELVDAEDHGDRVFVISKGSARGRASGAPAEEVLFQVWTFRDGKILRYEEYYDEDAARKALDG